MLMEMEAGARQAFGVGFLGGGGGEQEQAANPYSHGRTVLETRQRQLRPARESPWRAAAEGAMGGGFALELRLSKQEAPWATR
jgi:hypothetical protein